MNSLIKHIGINVVETDIEPFYIDILGGTKLHTFTLQPEIAFNIFNLKKEVEVVIVKYDSIEFELFIHPMPQSFSFSHICIRSNQAENIAKSATINGFSLFTLQNNNKVSYFISDHNYNLFEIKQ
ncbi:MAG: hypothetical protein KA792_01240 [Bacteroidales bacterium]|nr:hypothetical protein [Bacteroidales bacterium]